MSLILTLDVGTTAVKAGLFDDNLNQLGVAIEEYTLYTPQSGIVELTPETYWNNAKRAINTVAEKSHSNLKEVCAIACTTQGETLIPIDQNGNALGNAVVWLDNRAEKEAELLKTLETDEEFYRCTGLPERDGFLPLSKILWFKKIKPELYNKTYKFLLLEDYLVYRLCGKIVTNPSILSSTGYYDIVQGKYREDILEKCDIDILKFPEVMPCCSVIGNVNKETIYSIGLSDKAVVTTGAMDQVTMAIGCGNIREGIVNDTIGTAQVLGATCGGEILKEYRGITVYKHVIPDKYFLLSFNQSAGIVLKWYRNEFCKDILQEFGEADSFDEMSRLAKKEPPLSKGVTFEINGDSNSFTGISLAANRGCFIRAIMEAVCLKSRQNLKNMGIHPEVLISLGGGGKSAVWNQIKADIMNKPIITLDIEESALFGAAILAARATNMISSVSRICSQITKKEEYKPNINNVILYEEV